MLISFVAPPAAAGDPERGKTLHDQHCTRCHDSTMYARPQRTIADFAALRERVQQCELAAELMWFEEDVDDVAAWLNRDFYHFAEDQAK
jgi:mono/diheme cytochrome c family protein